MNYLFWYLEIGLGCATLWAVWRALHLWKKDISGIRSLGSFLRLSFFLAAVFVVFSAGWPILVPMFIYTNGRGRIAARSPAFDEQKFAPTPGDLVQAFSLKEVELLETVIDPLGAAPEISFGHLNSAWQAFVQTFEPSDELWTYQTVWTNKWDVAERREGYAIVSDEKVRSFFETVNCRLDAKREEKIALPAFLGSGLTEQSQKSMVASMGESTAWHRILYRKLS